MMTAIVVFSQSNRLVSQLNAAICLLQHDGRCWCSVVPDDRGRDCVALPARGVIVPLITPMDPDGTEDLDSFASLIDFVSAHGVDGVLILGSSGECIALSARQRQRIVKFAVDCTRGRTHLMVGVPTLGSTDVLNEARWIAEHGADSLLVAAPAGMRLSASEMHRHFQIVASAGPPVVAYDVPSRVGAAFDLGMLATLAENHIIAGVKDSTGDIVKARKLAEITRKHQDLLRYTGCEEVIDGSLLAGYHGAIPGLANVFPQFHVALVRQAGAGNWAQAAQIQAQIVALLGLYSHALPGGSFLAQFFASIKLALVQLGVITHATTSPIFVQADDSLRAHVDAILTLAEELAQDLPVAEAVSES
jgi:4-hydroxy-tetrahydrodipicolinate synthase